MTQSEEYQSAIEQLAEAQQEIKRLQGIIESDKRMVKKAQIELEARKVEYTERIGKTRYASLYDLFKDRIYTLDTALVDLSLVGYDKPMQFLEDSITGEIEEVTQ